MPYYLQYASGLCLIALMQSGPVALTQHKINELAGKCFNAQYALSGLKGVKKTGESQDQYSIRIKSYLAALDDTDKALRPLKQVPALIHSSPENEKIWKGIAANVGNLEHEIIETRAAWTAPAKAGDKSKLGQKLLQALNTVQAILAGLRDARP